MENENLTLREKEIKIDFSRPRNREIVLENKFLEYKREIMNLLK